MLGMSALAVHKREAEFPVATDDTPQNPRLYYLHLVYAEIEPNIKMEFLLWLSITFEWL